MSALKPHDRAIYFKREASGGQYAYGPATKIPCTVLKVGRVRAEVEFDDGRRAFVNLDKVVGGQLSPMWTEWLMGYPIGWTALDVSVTPWFQSKRGKHSRGLRESKRETA